MDTDIAVSDLNLFLDKIPVGHRRQRFHDLAQAMLDTERPMCIFETGCMRKSKLDGPEADGCSSLVWDYVARTTQGGFITVDINPENVEFAKSKLGVGSQVFCCDSVKFLSSVSRLTRPIDLLYLDSMDWEGTLEERALSALHHASELSAAWPLLNHEALIAIDDCPGKYSGKHAIVKRFFDSLGVEPLVDDYIHVWRKPMSTRIKFVL